MTIERAVTLLALSSVLLASSAAAAQQRDTTPQTRILQGCVTQAPGAAAVAGHGAAAAASAAGFWLDTVPGGGKQDDRSVKPEGQSGQPAGQQQLPTGQQTQAGQEPMAAVMDDDESPASIPTRYRLVPSDDGVRLTQHVGQRVELEGTVSTDMPAHRRHDGRQAPQGIAAPLTGLPGPGHQAAQPGPHYTSPDDHGDVAGTLRVVSVRVLAASCIDTP